MKRRKKIKVDWSEGYLILDPTAKVKVIESKCPTLEWVELERFQRVFLDEIPISGLTVDISGIGRTRAETILTKKMLEEEKRRFIQGCKEG